MCFQLMHMYGHYLDLIFIQNTPRQCETYNIAEGCFTTSGSWSLMSQKPWWPVQPHNLYMYLSVTFTVTLTIILLNCRVGGTIGYNYVVFDRMNRPHRLIVNWDNCTLSSANFSDCSGSCEKSVAGDVFIIRHKIYSPQKKKLNGPEGAKYFFPVEGGIFFLGSMYCGRSSP